MAPIFDFGEFPVGLTIRFGSLEFSTTRRESCPSPMLAFTIPLLDKIRKCTGHTAVALHSGVFQSIDFHEEAQWYRIVEDKIGVLDK